MISNKWIVLTLAAGLMTLSLTCAAGQVRLVDDLQGSDLPALDSASPDDPSGMTGDPSSPNDGSITDGIDNGFPSDAAPDTGAGDSDNGSVDTATGDDDY